MTLLAEATRWWQHGYTPLPVAPDGTKRPLVAWKTYQTTRPTIDELCAMFAADHDGLGIITGAVSGNLEMLELEGRAVQGGILDTLAQAMTDHGQDALWAAVSGGYAETTPSGGIHWYYRVVDGPAAPNTRLARTPGGDVLIETRGEGGYTVIAPSAGRTHPTGNAWTALTGTLATIAKITAEQRDTIHAICTVLDQTPEPDVTYDRPTGAPSTTPTDGTLRPGDDYNHRATWADILEPHGWRIIHRTGQLLGWQRPGKQHHGLSATTGRNTADRLYVFSTSTEFEAERPYSKFAAYTLLEHGGDWTKATRALAAAGYGTQQRPPLRLVTSPDPADPFGTGLPATTGALALAPDVDTDPLETVDEATGEIVDTDFWASRPILTHIREFSLARMTSPWAVLACVMLRALATIPPHVVLPPIIGGSGSLNLFAALVGPSGVGKGAAESAAAEAVTFGTDIYTAQVGSGEGIAHAYAHRATNKELTDEKADGNGIVWDHTSVLFSVPEVDTLGALGARQGATLMSQIRSAFSGEALGFGYADATKRIPIGKHKYRLGMTVGVQPEKSGTILWDADGGTPQRFIWVPATDKQISADPPPQPEPVRVTIDGKAWASSWADSGFRTIAIPTDVVRTIREAHASRARGEGESLDGHALFAREKVAVALAILDGRTEVDLDDWALSERVMTVSDRTRTWCQAVLDRKQGARDEAAARREARRLDIIATEGADRSGQRVAHAVMRHVNDAPMAYSALRRKLNSRDRDWFDDALARLVDAGQITIEETPSGQLVRRAG